MNPWLTIPADDYEGHMSHGSVRQLQALSSIFADTMARYRPRSLAVLGCATGNGFEHIRPETTTTVYALDINSDYLERLHEHFAPKLPGLRLVCADVLSAELPHHAFEHVHAGLLFEYLEPAAALQRIIEWLAPSGVLSVVLQRPSASAGRVSETPYPSLRTLTSFMRLVDPVELVASAREVGLTVVETYARELPQGKRFMCLCFEAG